MQGHVLLKNYTPTAASKEYLAVVCS